MLSTSLPNTLISRDRRAILLWLAVCAALVACMVLIGGYTRLSGSGLSITSWKPIHGTLPPLNAEQWQEEFTAYQSSPQYRKVNNDMTVGQFKTIFWPEYIHRLLGRLIGAAFFIPLVVFALRRSIRARFSRRLAGIFALGGLQGLIGWLMVASGLVDDPQVSPIRLALHLSLALLIYALIVWAIMDIVASGEGQAASKNARKSLIICHMPLITYSTWFALLCLQIILGAFMAGLHGGLIYNTWPDMNGRFLPDRLFSDRIALIQFLHRNLAVLVAAGFAFWWYLYRTYVINNHLGKDCAAIAGIVVVQFALGVSTLLHQAPLNLALAHQMGALALFTAGLVLLYKICHCEERSDEAIQNWITTVSDEASQ